MSYAARCFICEKGCRIEEARMSVHREKEITLCRAHGRELLQAADMLREIEEGTKKIKKPRSRKP